MGQVKHKTENIPSAYPHSTKYAGKKWVYKPSSSAEVVGALGDSINVNSHISSLLVQRGIFDFEAAKQFFRPSLDGLHDPFLMKDMVRAVKRIKSAFDKGEKILIYGDYDVDGTTAVALVYNYFKKFYAHCDFYIPDRLTEGYGISEQGIVWAEENGFSLIIALDLGVQEVNRVILAKQKGIDFIICDHHVPGNTLPDAVAVLNPKRKDCNYPFQELSGCGLGFKLIQALAQQYSTQFDVMDNIDLVAVSIASDIVPINGENRILAHHGLKKLNTNPTTGLAALKKVAGISGVLSISDIVFKIGPRINAAGRVAHAREAIELLVAGKKEAAGLSKQLDDKNRLRQQWDIEATTEALSMITSEQGHQKNNSTVLYKQDWNKGIIGIVASRCIETHYKPTLILTQSNGDLVGSGRSIRGFDLHKAMCNCSDLLEKFGGHKYAVGLSLKEENLGALRERFEEIVSSTLTEDMLVPTIDIDMPLPLSSITEKFFSVLKQMAPFGPAHPKPVFVAKQVFSAGSLNCFQDKHVRFLAQQKGNDCKIYALGFDMAHYYDKIAQGAYFSIAFTIEENDFRGNISIELRIKDIKFE